MKLETLGAVEYGGSWTDCALTFWSEIRKQMGYACSACIGINSLIFSSALKNLLAVVQEIILSKAITGLLQKTSPFY